MIEIQNVAIPTFAELSQLADSLWDSEQYAAASRIYLSAAGRARRHRFYAAEATALLFAWRAHQIATGEATAPR